jgi:hypothetical protein
MSNCRLVLFLALSLLAVQQVQSAVGQSVKLRVLSNGATMPVMGEENRNGVWVDTLELARLLGGTAFMKNDVTLIEFSSHTVAISGARSTYSVRMKGKKGWENYEFPVRLPQQQRLLVPLDSVPAMFRVSLTYHRQLRELRVNPSATPPASSVAAVKVRAERRDQQTWIAIEDLAQALKLVSFSPQANRISVVLPDFTIVEFRSGDNTVFARNSPFARINDPVLTFAGSLYITQRSIFPVFGIDPKWNAAQSTLLLPAAYGRGRDISSPSPFKITYLGHAARPPAFSVEEISAYYQDPAPSYPADSNDLYESVRDILTNNPIPQKTNDYGHVSGHALLSLQADPLKAPLDGRGLFEKTGPKARLSNGRIGWGFPKLRLEGGREYVTMGGLNNHFSVVDQVYLSHSNDHYGDKEVNPSVAVRAGYGQQDVSVFLSTNVFSQVVNVRQKSLSAGIDLSHALAPRHRVSFKLDQFFFSNELRDVTASYDNLELLRDILGDDYDLSVDPTDQIALTRSVFSDDHRMSLGQLTYAWDGVIELGNVVGLSGYKDEKGKRINDTDVLTRMLLGKKKSRLEMSYEKAGPQYRSLGNPLRYQDRTIYRMSPFIDITRWWKIFGEIRREDNRVLVRQGLAPNRITYASGVNMLTFKTNVFRTSLNAFDASLYGSRVKMNQDYTHYFGRDSLDLGVGVDTQRTRLDTLFARSYSVRGGYQVARTNWRWSVNQEFIRHHYYSIDRDRHTSISNALIAIKSWKALAYYERAPKYFNLEDRLHTGTLRIGRQTRNKKIVNVFGAVTSLNSNLTSPEVWRAGAEYVLDFF